MNVADVFADCVFVFLCISQHSRSTAVQTQQTSKQTATHTSKQHTF